MPVNLPTKSYSLDSDGILAFVRHLQTMPNTAQVMASFESDPRSAITTVFQLNGMQKGAVARMTDEQLLQFVDPIVSGLRANKSPSQLQFVSQSVGTQASVDIPSSTAALDETQAVDRPQPGVTTMLKCECHIKISW